MCWRGRGLALLPEVKSHYGRLKMYIDGEWFDSESGVYRETTNPATGEPIAEYPIALPEEVNRAVEAAEKAFEEWKEMELRRRIQYIYRLREKFEEHFDELARILVQDHGRTIEEARGSIRRSIENIESACAMAYTVAKGEHVDQIARNIDETLVYEPLGVFAIITPYNIPVHAWSSFVPYALALGCTVVVSPASLPSYFQLDFQGYGGGGLPAWGCQPSLRWKRNKQDAGFPSQRSRGGLHRLHKGWKGALQACGRAGEEGFH